MTALEAKLLQHLDDETLAHSTVGPDTQGFFCCTARCGPHEGQGVSRSQTSALAYALQALADDLMGVRKA